MYFNSSVSVSDGVHAQYCSVQLIAKKIVKSQQSRVLPMHFHISWFYFIFPDRLAEKLGHKDLLALKALAMTTQARIDWTKYTSIQVFLYN